MSSSNWKGGKAKGIAQAKAWLRHNDKEKRAEMEHSNPDIDKTLTDLNFEVGPMAGTTYEEKCAKLDGLCEEYGFVAGAGKNTRVPMQAVDVYPPDGLSVIGDDGLHELTPELKQWFERAGEVWSEYFGEEGNLGMFVDADEQHMYRDVDTGEMRLSEIHMHIYNATLVPDGKGGVKFSAKEFSSRKNIIAFNNALEKMTQEEFGCNYNTGEPRPERGNKSAEELKRESAKLETKAQKEEFLRVVEQTNLAAELRDELVEDVNGMSAEKEALEGQKSQLQDEISALEPKRKAAKQTIAKAKKDKQEAEELKDTAAGYMQQVYAAHDALKTAMGEEVDPNDYDATVFVRGGEWAEATERKAYAIEAREEDVSEREESVEKREGWVSSDEADMDAQRNRLRLKAQKIDDAYEQMEKDREQAQKGFDVDDFIAAVQTEIKSRLPKNVYDFVSSAMNKIKKRLSVSEDEIRARHMEAQRMVDEMNGNSADKQYGE